MVPETTFKFNVRPWIGRSPLLGIAHWLFLWPLFFAVLSSQCPCLSLHLPPSPLLIFCYFSAGQFIPLFHHLLPHQSWGLASKRKARFIYSTHSVSELFSTWTNSLHQLPAGHPVPFGHYLGLWVRPCKLRAQSCKSAPTSDSICRYGLSTA